MRTACLLLAVAGSVFAQNSTTTGSPTSLGPLCPNACQISVAATQVVYPYRIKYATTTFTITRVNIYVDSNGRTTGRGTTSRPIPPPPTHVWVHAGVTLTYPTVYSQYSKFSHFIAEPVGTACSTRTASLTLPAPTNWGPLILPTGSIPDGVYVAPEVVGYLNGLSTVTEQLGGTIQAEQACTPFLTKRMLHARQTPIDDTTFLVTVTDSTGSQTFINTTPERQETTNPPFPSFTRFTNSTTQSSTQAPSSAEPSSSSVLPSSSATLSSSDLASSSDLPSASDFPLSSQVTTTPPLPPVATSVVNVTVTLPPVRTTSRPIENTNAAVPARQILALGGIEAFLIGVAGMLLGWL